MSYHANAEDLVCALWKLEGVQVAFNSGEPLFRLGDTPYHIILIGKGTLRIDLNLQRRGIDKKKLALLQNRRIWGLQELMLKKAFKWTAVSKYPIEGKLIRGQYFLNQLKKKPMLKFKILTLLSQEVKILTPQYE